MKIIAIEGADRLSKSTQAKLLSEKLGWIYIKFPNEDYYSGKIIRKILKEELPFEPVSFQALQILNRFETFEHLDPTQNYVFDRYKLSGIVYGLADGLPEEWIREICDLLPDPEITIVFFGHPFGEDTDIYGSKEHQSKISKIYDNEILVRGHPSLFVNGQTVEELFDELLMKLPEGIL